MTTLEKARNKLIGSLMVFRNDRSHWDTPAGMVALENILAAVDEYVAVERADATEEAAKVCDGWMHADGDQCAAAIRTKAVEQVVSLLKGIDKNELDDELGWWQTSDGARFGAEKLAAIKALKGTPKPVGPPNVTIHTRYVHVADTPPNPPTTMTTTVDRKACPFCGSNDISDGEILSSDTTNATSAMMYVQSECRNCGAAGPRAEVSAAEPLNYGSAKALTAWNRRAPSPNEQAIIQEYWNTRANKGEV